MISLIPCGKWCFSRCTPELLDLSLQSARQNLGFIDRIMVLTKPDARAAIEVVAARHFPQHVILTDDELLDGTQLTLEHTPRNSWLRKLLYAQDCIEPNFLAADEDYLALRPLGLAYFQAEACILAISSSRTWAHGSPGPNHDKL
jgi:hypothetical protein